MFFVGQLLGQLYLFQKFKTMQVVSLICVDSYVMYVLYYVYVRMYVLIQCKLSDTTSAVCVHVHVQQSRHNLTPDHILIMCSYHCSVLEK